MRSYLDQLTVSSRPSTVAAASLALRHLAAHLTETDLTCKSVAAIERRHIESYKVALAARPGKGRRQPGEPDGRSGTTWGWHARSSSASSTGTTPMAPGGFPFFTGDLPKADEPTPKFLDDPTAAKFMAALATDPNRRRRLMVELLARTGIRAGELGGLRDDAMYRLGDTYWLRIPLGQTPQRAHRAAASDAGRSDQRLPGLARTNQHRTARGTRRPPALRPAHHPPLRRGRRPTRRHRPCASARSCVTPSRPNASTGACRSKPSPHCSAIAHPA